MRTDIISVIFAVLIVTNVDAAWGDGIRRFFGFGPKTTTASTALTIQTTSTKREPSATVTVISAIYSTATTTATQRETSTSHVTHTSVSLLVYTSARTRYETLIQMGTVTQTQTTTATEYKKNIEQNFAPQIPTFQNRQPIATVLPHTHSAAVPSETAAGPSVVTIVHVSTKTICSSSPTTSTSPQVPVCTPPAPAVSTCTQYSQTSTATVLVQNVTIEGEHQLDAIKCTTSTIWPRPPLKSAPTSTRRPPCNPRRTLARMRKYNTFLREEDEGARESHNSTQAAYRNSERSSSDLGLPPKNVYHPDSERLEETDGGESKRKMRQRRVFADTSLRNYTGDIKREVAVTATVKTRSYRKRKSTPYAPIGQRRNQNSSSKLDTDDDNDNLDEE
jgi:hypothetical protein